MLNRILKYVILVLLILLAILSVTYKFDDCSLCSFKINNTKYSANDLSILYYNKCIFKEQVDYSQLIPFELSPMNLSLQK
jgi:hypothetical protein